MNIEKIFSSCISLIVLSGVLFFHTPGIAQDYEGLHLGAAQDELDLADAYGGEEFVSIATGNQQLLYLAPAVTTVITAKDIKRIGATNLDDVLETVPGLHVSRDSVYRETYQIRGISTRFNPQVLVLVNGIPITNVFAGNRGQVRERVPVQNIARLEVIRGPGSAVHGADAFAGVINIVTKTSEDINGLEFGTRVGSFDTQEAWLLFGKDWGDIDIALSFQYGETDGQNERIDSDAQSFFDTIFPSTASLSPGSVNLEQKYLNTQLDVGYGDWRLRMGYAGREDAGLGAGLAESLDPVGSADSDFINADLNYKNLDFFQDWQIEAQLSFFNTSNRSNLVLNPPGSVFLGLFPNGVLGNPDVYERHYRASGSGLYTGLSDHQIKAGFGFRLEDLYKVEESKNFFIPPPPAPPLPTPLATGFTNVTDTAAFVRETDRKIWFAFLQDEWSFLPDWTATIGVRFDHYSDFGSTVNPRFALVWQTTYDLTTKLLYGRAFRAPAFQELFLVNNPVAVGNPNLDPETIDSVELAFDYSPREGIRSKLNLFYYHIDDLISFVNNVAANSGQQSGFGLEFESTWDITDSLRFHGNYAYQNSRDDNRNKDVGFAPTHQIYGRADWQFFSGLNLDLQANWVGERKRSPGDPRLEIDDYVTVDLTLRGRVPGDYFEVAFSVRNLFDENAREPSLPSAAAGAQGSLIPGDLPLAGQSIYGEIRFNLE